METDDECIIELGLHLFHSDDEPFVALGGTYELLGGLLIVEV